MSDFKIVTKTLAKGVYKLIFTQKINILTDTGHFNYCILDNKGNVVITGSNTGSPKNEYTKKDLQEIFDRAREVDIFKEHSEMLITSKRVKELNSKNPNNLVIKKNKEHSAMIETLRKKKK